MKMDYQFIKYLIKTFVIEPPPRAGGWWVIEKEIEKSGHEARAYAGV